MSRVRAVIGKHAATAFLLALVLIYASEISSIRSLFDEGFVSTRFLPKLLVGVALGAIIWIAVRDARSEPANEAETDAAAPPGHGKPILLFGVIIGYIALFQPIGFVLSTVALSICCLWMFDFGANRSTLLSRILLTVFAASVLTGLAYLLFSIAFGARLPLFPGFV